MLPGDLKKKTKSKTERKYETFNQATLSFILIKKKKEKPSCAFNTFNYKNLEIHLAPLSCLFSSFKKRSSIPRNWGVEWNIRQSSGRLPIAIINRTFSMPTMCFNTRRIANTAVSIWRYSCYNASGQLVRPITRANSGARRRGNEKPLHISINYSMTGMSISCKREINARSVRAKPTLANILEIFADQREAGSIETKRGRGTRRCNYSLLHGRVQLKWLSGQEKAAIFCCLIFFNFSRDGNYSNKSKSVRDFLSRNLLLFFFLSS